MIFLPEEVSQASQVMNPRDKRYHYSSALTEAPKIILKARSNNHALLKSKNAEQSGASANRYDHSKFGLPCQNHTSFGLFRLQHVRY